MKDSREIKIVRVLGRYYDAIRTLRSQDLPLSYVAEV